MLMKEGDKIRRFVFMLKIQWWTDLIRVGILCSLDRISIESGRFVTIFQLKNEPTLSTKKGFICVHFNRKRTFYRENQADE